MLYNISVIDDIAASYRRAHTRLLLLDYDGTLSPFQQLPHQAKPTPALLALLERLAGDPQNKVVIISGRDHETLEAWLGHLPLDFASEHGLYIKENGGGWHLLHRHDDAWKKEIRQILDEFTHAVPGSFTEEKTASFAWHYRPAKDQALAAKALPQLARRLEPVVAANDLTLLKGNKVLDVKLAGVDKGTVAHHWLAKRSWDFILAAGDDTTDEDLFKAMPRNAQTIKIGAGATMARERQRSVRALHALLHSLTE